MSIPNVVYNINVQSKFSLFLDDELCEAEPEEIVKKLQIDKKKKEAALKEAKKQKNQKPVKSEPEPVKMDDKKLSEKAPRFQKSERSSKNYSNEKSVSKEFNEENSDKNRTRNRKSSSSGPRKFRGREFDRHSGSDKTGVKPVDKRDGSGAHNWGNVKDDIEVAKDELNAKDEQEKHSDNEPQVDSEKKEAEKTTMTFAEWRALNKENSVISAGSRHRPANNGEDVFSGMNAYQKRTKNTSESDNEIVVPDDEFDSKGRREIKVNVEFTGRNRRGGRGGFNNGRYNKDEKKKQEKDVLINLDENDFPKLS